MTIGDQLRRLADLMDAKPETRAFACAIDSVPDHAVYCASTDPEAMVHDALGGLVMHAARGCAT